MQAHILSGNTLFSPGSSSHSADDVSVENVAGSDHGESQKRKAFKRISAGSSSRDEMNLAEFPLAVLSTRVNPKVKTLEFKDYQRKANGELIERKWIITGADKFGLPTSTDDDVVLGLIRMTMDQGFREHKVYFTRYELLKTLRWSTEGRSYSRLIKSLDRLSGVRIRSSNSFYDNSTKSYQTCNFGIIDAYEINDERVSREGEGPTKSFFIWSEMLFDSFKAGFVKKLDLEYYFSLKSAVSRRLYRYLDKHFYYKSAFEMPLTVLAFEKVGLSRSYRYISSIKQQLEPGAKELVESGFLESFEFAGSGSQTVVRFKAKSLFQSGGLPTREPRTEIPHAEASRQRDMGVHRDIGAQGAEGPGATDPLSSALAARGISDTQARRLLLEKSTVQREKIGQIIRYYDMLLGRHDQKVSKNPVGFLYRAVEASERFVLPEEGKPLRKRPELTVFTAASAADSLSETTRRQHYRNFVDTELAKGVQGIAPDSLEMLRESIEQKMALLRPILSEARFSEAISGCMREELIKKFKITPYELWS